MASRNFDAILIHDLSGGRNDSDPPAMLPDDQCQEALNVDWWEGTLAHKRNGSTALSTTFSSGGPFTGLIGSVLRHVPGNSEAAAELWAVDDAGVVGRLAGATTFTAPTMADATTDSVTWTGASLDGKFFLGFDSAQNRLHCWDPANTKVRRVGLATPSPPTVATQGGSGLSFTRYYRIRVVDISGSDTRRRSEASTSVSITITDDAGVTVTRPSLPGEDETHWEAEYADAAAGPWYRASQIVAATTTYSDTAATISTTNLTAADGINYPPPSARFVISDDNRLVMAASFETSGGYVTPKETRVWFTPVLGSNDVGDAERIPSGNYLDVEAAITGLAGPLQGSVYVFSYRRIWKLVATGIAAAPYQRFGISNGIGCIHHKSIVQADDEHGNPAIYFLSHRGPYRLGAQGLQYLGKDNETLWATVNLAPTGVTAHGVYHADKHQVWWWICTAAANNANVRMVFDTKLGRMAEGGAVRRGWAKHTGGGANARCSVMFSNTVAASMSIDLKPYIGQFDANNRIWKCDSTATDDAGTTFQAYVDTKEYAPAGLGRNVKLMEPSLLAEVASGVTLTVTGRIDHGLRSDPTGTALLTASGSETRVQKKIEGFAGADAGSVSFRIGDASAASNGWTADALIVPFEPGANR